MERRLIKQGNSAYTITLPITWVRARGLTTGSPVQVTEHNNKLTIQTENTSKTTTTDINVTSLPRSMIWHKLLRAYIDGADTITITHNNPATIEDTGKQLIGMIVTQHNKNHSTLQTITQTPADTLEQLLRRVTHMLAQQANNLQQVDNTMTQQEYLNYELLMDMNIYYCMRYLNKYADRTHDYRTFLLLATIEHAGDQLRDIAKKKPSKELRKIIAEEVSTYAELLFKKDLQKLYTQLRAFRNKLPAQGRGNELAYALAQTLYNNLGYLVQD